MPFFKIQTNAEVSNKPELLKKLSKAAASAIGKPEAYVMTAFSSADSMTFGGTEDPAAFIECKSIGLKEEQTSGLSRFLCTFCREEMNIPENRVYIEFASAQGVMWGWDSRTF